LAVGSMQLLAALFSYRVFVDHPNCHESCQEGPASSLQGSSVNAYSSTDLTRTRSAHNPTITSRVLVRSDILSSVYLFPSSRYASIFLCA